MPKFRLIKVSVLKVGEKIYQTGDIVDVPQETYDKMKGSDYFQELPKEEPKTAPAPAPELAPSPPVEPETSKPEPTRPEPRRSGKK
jgi:hypothetical protein